MTPHSPSPARLAAAIRARDYFDLQLRFAETMAARGGIPLDYAIAHYTNFHRRFGLGNVDADGLSPEWPGYIQRLLSLATHDQRLDWTIDFLARSPDETMPASQFGFGCFRCEAPNAHGNVRIHFGNRDSADGVGPLGRAKIAARQGELRSMFAFLARDYPDATGVDGGSWLYNIEAYRRLFPPAFSASRKQPYFPLKLHGTSSWGQFIDHTGAVRPDIAARFLDNLRELDPKHPTRVFPLQVLVTHAPMADFHALYGTAPT